MEKINKAIEYFINHGMTKESANDAANIYASSYEEYNALWAHINDVAYQVGINLT